MTNKNFDHLINEKFGKLTIINIYYKFNEKTRKNRLFCYCVCDCGNYTNVMFNKLQTGNTKSCGCIKKENGKIWAKNREKNNIYDLTGNFGIGYFYNTNNVFYFDLENYDIIKNYCWYEDTGYAVQNKNKKERMHRIILKIKNLKTKVDHVNRNGLDNRKENLRIATSSQNRINSSIRSNNKTGITGVYKRKNSNLWYGSISINKIKLAKGFNQIDDAIKWRLSKEKEIFLDFAPQKNLFEKYGII